MDSRRIYNCFSVYSLSWPLLSTRLECRCFKWCLSELCLENALPQKAHSKGFNLIWTL